MFTEVKNLFVRPSNDFFGPEATEDNLTCPIDIEMALDHLVMDCNEGIGRVKVIDQMAKGIAESKVRPAWIRHNGSVDLRQLRQSIEMTDKVAKMLLTDAGYVKLSDLHFCDRTLLNSWTKEEGERADWVRCVECMHDYSQVTVLRALALRIHMGTSFDPRAAKKLFEDPQKVAKVEIYQTLNIPKPDNLLKAVKNATLGWQFDRYFWTRSSMLTLFAIAVIGSTVYTGNFQALSVFPIRPL